MKVIKLSNSSKVALIDDSDYESVSKYKYHAKKGHGDIIYALRSVYIKGKNPYTTKIPLHHDIVGTPPTGFEVDHKNRDGLDNQRNNLRVVTRRQNCQNRKPRTSSHGFKGVRSEKRRGTFYAKIGTKKGELYLGEFKTAEEAAKVYDQKALELFGEFARLNFPTKALLP